MEYEITVDERIDARWTTWFDGLTVASSGVEGTTSTIRGDLADQAALHGVLHRLRDLGIPLVSVVPVPDVDHQTRSAHDLGTDQP